MLSGNYVAAGITGVLGGFLAFQVRARMKVDTLHLHLDNPGQPLDNLYYTKVIINYHTKGHDWFSMFQQEARIQRAQHTFKSGLPPHVLQGLAALPC